jgi:hypothetical protein
MHKGSGLLSHDLGSRRWEGRLEPPRLEERAIRDTGACLGCKGRGPLGRWIPALCIVPWRRLEEGKNGEGSLPRLPRSPR